MTRIKLCGLYRLCDIETANKLKPEYIGFVFAPKSKRYVSAVRAAKLKQVLSLDIKAVGVFVDENVNTVADLLNHHIIDIAQLHGNEDKNYIEALRMLTNKPIIKAFQIISEQDIISAENSTADFILLDSGAGTGETFNWSLLRNIRRPYFLAGGLTIENASEAVKKINPFAVDVSSGIETNGIKDKTKMTAFVAAVRNENRL